MRHGGSRRNERDMLWKDFVGTGEYVVGSWENFPIVFERTWKPACDVFETEKHYIVVVEMAGVSPRDVEVVHQGRRLAVKGHRRDVSTFPKKDFYQMEIFFGPFYREIVLPDEIDQASIKAHFRNGLLVMECPKKAIKAEKRIHIE